MNAQFLRPDGWPDNGEPTLRYENTDRTMVVKDEDIEGANGFRFGIKAGVQYEIITGGKWYVVPGIFYNFGLTKVSSTREDWRIDALQIGVDVRFAI
ncbi:MAG: hypothetical protein QG635_2318 [Bacteroidota bacterium]|nr:hypothetical protein [Bacteroidota bacterium]